MLEPHLLRFPWIFLAAFVGLAASAAAEHLPFSPQHSPSLNFIDNVPSLDSNEIAAEWAEHIRKQPGGLLSVIQLAAPTFLHYQQLADAIRSRNPSDPSLRHVNQFNRQNFFVNPQNDDTTTSQESSNSNHGTDKGVLPNISPQCMADLGSLAVEVFAIESELTALEACLKQKNQTCEKIVLSKLAKHEWILKVLDSQGKLPTGLGLINLFWPGSWQECWDMKLPHGEEKPMKPCVAHLSLGKILSHVTMKPNGSLSMELGQRGSVASGARDSSEIPDVKSLDELVPYVYLTQNINFGVCVPKNCSSDDLFNLINFKFNSSKDPVGYATCNAESLDVSTDQRAVGVISFLGVFGAGILLGTVIDLINEFRLDVKILAATSSDTLYQCITAFSFYTNTKKLLTTDHKPGEIRCIHGIRFLSMAWVMYGHTYAFTIGPLDGWIPFLESMSTLIGQTFANATVSVDSFFCMSGFLLTYLFMKDTEKNHGENLKRVKFWIMYYVHRYIRLTPPYMIIMGVTVALGRYLGNGPLWPQATGFEQNFCKYTWWANGLYINNFIREDYINIVDSKNISQGQCFGHTWYLANDMQFYWLAPILLLTFWFSKWNGVEGLILTLIVSVVSMAYRGLEIKWHHLSPTTIGGENPHLLETEANFGKYLYELPWMRVSPYIVGMATGYLFWKFHGKMRLPKILQLLGWVLALGSMGSCVWGLQPWASGMYELSDGLRALYGAVNRTVWAAGLSWIIYACAAGKGGPINAFLSWSVWIPLSRLTYCAYLVHPIFIYLFVNTHQRNIHIDSNYTLFYFFMGHLMVGYAVAYVASMSFEAPIMGIERTLRARFGRQQQQSQAAGIGNRHVAINNNNKDATDDDDSSVDEENIIDERGGILNPTDPIPS